MWFNCGFALAFVVGCLLRVVFWDLVVVYLCFSFVYVVICFVVFEI